ncbi:MAG: OFA family MFS transporter [Candidatus Omnitrophota bacterium]
MGRCQSGSCHENRWLVAIMGTVLQLCLGTVYAWSFFQKPLVNTYGWSNSQAAWTFCFAIFFLGIASAWGGINLPKFGPKKLAITGGVLYGLGYFVAAFALQIKSLLLLYVGFGLIGGLGLGLGYVTPVATAAKWFPDKKGFITGMVIMGFGLGALLMSKVIAPLLINLTGGNLVQVFAFIGVVMLCVAVPAAAFLKNPPQGFSVPGSKGAASAHVCSFPDGILTAKQCIFSSRFLLMWLIFFLNITAGIMFIGFQSPMLQDLLKKVNPLMTVSELAAAGATLIAVSSIFNGLGRFFWGGLSDRIGRVQVFRLILASQVFVFVALLFVKQPFVFGIFVCYVLLCYGGGFGSMPSFVHDVFGHKLMPVVYGVILTAWSMGGIVGPQIVAFIKDHYAAGASGYTFGAGAMLLAIGFVISLFLNNKHFTDRAK